jgi:hypothetical protein
MTRIIKYIRNFPPSRSITEEPDIKGGIKTGKCQAYKGGLRRSPRRNEGKHMSNRV